MDQNEVGINTWNGVYYAYSSKDSGGFVTNTLNTKTANILGRFQRAPIPVCTISGPRLPRGYGRRQRLVGRHGPRRARPGLQRLAPRSLLPGARPPLAPPIGTGRTLCTPRQLGLDAPSAAGVFPTYRARRGGSAASAPARACGDITFVAFGRTASSWPLAVKTARCASGGSRTVCMSAFRRRAPGVVHRLAFSPDGARLAVGYSGHVIVWEVATNQPLHAIADPGLHHLFATLDRLDFSPDGKRLTIGWSKESVACYDTATWQPVCRLPHPYRQTRSTWSVQTTAGGRTVYANDVAGDGGGRQQQALALWCAVRARSPAILSPNNQIMPELEGSARWDINAGHPVDPFDLAPP